MAPPSIAVLCSLLALLCAPAHSRTSYRSNICKMVNNKPLCCQGWSLDATNLHCSIPVCSGECEILGGRCIKPDMCLCPGGYVAYSCYVASNRGSSSRCNVRCENGGTCKNYRCSCPPGFSGERCQIASCPNDCSGRGKCLSTGRCECKDGYGGNDCSEEPTGPCFQQVERGLCEKEVKDVLMTMQVCCNSVGAAWGTPCKKCVKSRCAKGFEFRNGRCEDINECRAITNVCKGGSCRNTEGKYTCDCPIGTTYDANTLECKKQNDMCTVKPQICGEGLCVSNTLGSSYRCKCFAGYRLSDDGSRCVSNAAFLTFNMCHYNRGYLCTNGVCVPKGRSYKCRCNVGYQLSEDERSCEKQINFCKLYGSRVCNNGLCRPLSNNDYRCDCNDGYEPSPDQKSCVSTCDRYGASLCPNGRCVPAKIGGYKCKCNRGYYQSLNQKSCVKETRVLRTVCDYYTLCNNGRCIPTDDAYRCVCNAGYEPTTDSKSCREKPKKRQHICELYADYYCPNAKCVPVGSSYRCECLRGFVMVEGRCRAESQVRKKPKKKKKKVKKSGKNFCTKYPHLCENGRCVPTSNYFYCECDAGYKAVNDRRRCRKEQAQPARLISGFYDFCQHYSSDCRGGTCHNEPTTFWCKCLAGYRWDENRLQCIKEKPVDFVSDEWNSFPSRESQPNSWAKVYSACEKMGREVCNRGYCVDKGSSYECKCYQGYQATEHKKRCEDINECDLNPNSCWQGRCVNTPGSYSCQCLKGFKLSHVNEEPLCVDRNECEDGNPCIHGSCRNTWGSYKCICYEGYTSDETGLQCREIGPYDKESIPKNKSQNSWKDRAMADSPSFVGNCSDCQYDCRWISNGKYVCECPPGLSTLGNSDLCAEEESVEQYTFEINMDEPERRRRRRSVPDHVANSHLKGRIILRSGVDADHFSNTLVSRYRSSDFYQVVRLGDLRSNGTHTVIDVVFT